MSFPRTTGLTPSLPPHQPPLPLREPAHLEHDDHAEHGQRSCQRDLLEHAGHQRTEEAVFRYEVPEDLWKYWAI